jgi:membrane associated rhomboid family serine protease
VFPIRDDNPHFLTPYVTYGLIAVNALCWLLVQGMGAEPALSESVCLLGLTPGDLLNTLPANSNVQIGPQTWCEIGDSSSFYTVLTSMFMHGGWMHIIGNMWFLWIFGNNIEDSMGHGRFLAFYLLCGLAAAAGQTIADPDSAIPMVGASGAIGGVMGAYVVLYPRVHVHMLIFLGFFVTVIAVPAIFMLGYWFLMQVLGGFGSVGQEGGGTAFWAHVGGFAAGAALIFLFKDPELVNQHPYHGLHQSQSPTRSWRRTR